MCHLSFWNTLWKEVYPALTGSKTPTLKLGWSKEGGWEIKLPVKARLVQLIISGDEQNPH
ncbi:hypothetical protein EWW47_27515 [Bacillus thuringiensis]|uniref:Uncharacterized protein n=1 Tax=Bacillus thuringiensis TaxID=1428 RepID=A0AB35PGH6_BACTU|nr:hypothetical protein DOS87_29905 [Bacillus sp. CR71]AXR25764.1 hypothetical protein DPQ26_29920 [Bacillus sp. E25]KAA0801239.1 hypothetical protein DN406_03525 [Bacillus sp. BB56-3]KAA0830002.1 hypothetical protein DN403_04105 [Bacillus sp. AY2-1]KAA8484546.1 hypothetical protein FYW98_23345 [Bacillus thuringiensis]TKH56270.1 hypothetical protein FC677_15330 [Bacillus cereus]